MGSFVEETGTNCLLTDHSLGGKNKTVEIHIEEKINYLFLCKPTVLYSAMTSITSIT